MRMPYLWASIFGILLLGTDLQAGRTSTQLTKENIDEQPFAFTIEVTGGAKEGQGTRFQVTVRPKGNRMAAQSRYVASLHIEDGKSLIASCPVAATTKDGTLSYSFFVTKPYLKDSRFTFGEEVGRGQEWSSGRYYSAILEDFAYEQNSGQTKISRNEWIEIARDHVTRDKSLQKKIDGLPYDPKKTRVRKNAADGLTIELNYGSLAYDSLATVTVEMDSKAKVLKMHVDLSGFD